MGGLIIVLLWILFFPVVGLLLGIGLGKLLGFKKKKLFAIIGLLSGIAFGLWLLQYH